MLLSLCYDITSGREMFINRSVFDTITDDIYCYQSQLNDNCNFLLFLLLYADDIILLSKGKLGYNKNIYIYIYWIYWKNILRDRLNKQNIRNISINLSIIIEQNWTHLDNEDEQFLLWPRLISMLQKCQNVGTPICS